MGAPQVPVSATLTTKSQGTSTQLPELDCLMAIEFRRARQSGPITGAAGRRLDQVDQPDAVAGLIRDAVVRPGA
jgi:hypothetical protein